MVYSFAGDTSLTNGYSAKPGVSPTAEGVYLWANDYVGVSNDTRIDYRYSIAETLTDHTADDYKIRTFDETYTPYVAPVTSDASVPSTPGTGSTPSAGGSSDGSVASTPSTPSTGAGFPMIVLGVGAAAAAAALVTFRKKHR